MFVASTGPVHLNVHATDADIADKIKDKNIQKRALFLFPILRVSVPSQHSGLSPAPLHPSVKLGSGHNQTRLLASMRLQTPFEPHQSAELRPLLPFC